MKWLLIISAMAVVCLSCNPTMYPLPDKNYDDISNIRSAKPVDETCAEVCRVFRDNGYSISDSDKNSGTMTTAKYDFSKRFSFVKNGKSIDSTAWVALSYVTNKGGFGDNPFSVWAYWKVSIKPDGTGSLIRIDLSKVDARVTKPGKKSFHPEQEYTFVGQSTGVFEKMMADAVR